MFKDYIVDIEKIIIDKYRFEAHKGETIKEHTDRCVMFFDKICAAKKLYDVFQNIEEILLKEKLSECKELFETLLINTIVFHDIGKINPRFQSIKMKRQEFKAEKGSDTLGSKHSFISSVIYLQYFLPKIFNLTEEVQEIMSRIIYINAYVISRHHVSLEDFMKYLIEFNENKEGFIQRKEIFDKLAKYIEEPEKLFEMDIITNTSDFVKECLEVNKEYDICCYTYQRLLFSLLVASDYYATSLWQGNVLVENYGTINDIENLYNIYLQTDIIKNIRRYQKENNDIDVINIKDINDLRTEMFLESEKNLLENIDENIFYLEAPTGSGKSNTALNLSLQFIKNCTHLNKIMYIYPFNTLVEQNEKILWKIFENDKKAISQIKVVNSITPIYQNTDESDLEYEIACQNALLDRQFFNYPISISTHVTLFEIMFGDSRESAFSFHQLANSVIILDEIQSYKNKIWTEIIVFLKMFAKLLNMKIIIMSATLPNLDVLSKEQTKAIRLINDSKKYFQNSCFKKRVSKIDYSLLNIEKADLFINMKELIEKYVLQKKKILIEFISKSAAEKFYKYLMEEIECKILCITGDDNSIERYRILKEVEDSPKGEPLVLVATQVIEAGVDLKNINVGFKDISYLDLEEQFIGRINRENNGEGIVYFFNYTDASVVYKEDMRVGFSLTMPQMQEILKNKNFDEFYERVFANINTNNNSLKDNENIEMFWNLVGQLNQKEIAERMKLIDDENICNIFFDRTLICPNGEEIDGRELWEKYRSLLEMRENISYPVFKVEVSKLISKMNNFIYRIRLNKKTFTYSDIIGELYYIEDGEKYFIEGKLNKEMLKSGIGDFI